MAVAASASLLRLSASAIPVLLLASAAAGQSAGLFTSVEAQSPGSAVMEAAAVDDLAWRSRLVTIDFGTLERVRSAVAQGATAQAKLALNLFPDAEYEAIVDRTEKTFSGGYSLSGSLVGEPLASVTLVVNGTTVAGSVRTSQATYRIRSVGVGRYAIGEVDESKRPEECGVSDVRFPGGLTEAGQP